MKVECFRFPGKISGGSAGIRHVGKKAEDACVFLQEEGVIAWMNLMRRF
jgi:hypothetical protein